MSRLPKAAVKKPPPNKCPDCNGEKGHWKTQNSGPDRWVPCGTCDGRGTV